MKKESLDKKMGIRISKDQYQKLGQVSNGNISHLIRNKIRELIGDPLVLGGIFIPHEVEILQKIAQIKKKNRFATYLALRGAITFVKDENGYDKLKQILTESGIYSIRGVNKCMQHYYETVSDLHLYVEKLPLRKK